MLHDAYATRVAPSGDHANVADLELDGLDRLAGLKIHLDAVVDLFTPTRRMKPENIDLLDLEIECARHTPVSRQTKENSNFLSRIKGHKSKLKRDSRNAGLMEIFI